MMKKISLFLFLFFSTGCSFFENTWQTRSMPEADYATLVKNVRIISQSSTHVTYEYRNIRVDELAVLAAIYCNEQTDKQAYLDKIVLQPDNARRAVFICKQH